MDEKIERAIAEMKGVREASDREYEIKNRAEIRQQMIEADLCILSGHAVGRLSELPMWAQAYIKALREALELPTNP